MRKFELIFHGGHGAYHGVNTICRQVFFVCVNVIVLAWLYISGSRNEIG